MTKPANYMYMSDVVDGILLIDEEYKSVYPPMFMVHPPRYSYDGTRHTRVY
jgi:hypothetical protein